MSKDLLVLCDGNNLAMRGVFALWKSGMTSPDGRDSRGLFGMMSALRTHFNQFGPTHMIWAFDRTRSQRRLDINPDYKGHRKYGSVEGHVDIRDILAPQYEAFEKFLDIVGVKHLWEDGEEADDLIARAVHTMGSTTTDCLIVSGDNDMLQLASKRPKVTVHQPSKKNENVFEFGVTAAQVESWFGVPPERLAELKAMIGDSSDSIEGVRGIGPKKALKILQQHGSLSEAIRKAPELIGHEQKVAKNYLLMELISDVRPLSVTLEDCRIPKMTSETEEAAQGFFDEWGFSSLKPRMFTS
jgi:DNA polymerase-1